METKMKLTTDFEVYKTGYSELSELPLQLEPIGCSIETDLTSNKPSLTTVVKIGDYTMTATSLQYLLEKLNDHQIVVKKKFPDDMTV